MAGSDPVHRAAVRAVRAAAALLICLLAFQAAAGGTLGQSPPATPTPPGSGGALFGAVRVLSGGDLPRNTGQENQPPVWITIDAKGSSAVVTIGNATRVPLDFRGTVVMNLAPDVQAAQVLVSTGSAVIQGDQVVWSGFSLGSGDIVPAIVQLAPAGGTPGPAATSAISSVAIEAKSAQSGAIVNEQVAGGGPPTTALRPPPGNVAPAGRPGSGSAASVTPLSQSTARTFGAVALALLTAALAALALVAVLIVATGRRLERQLKAATAPAGPSTLESTRFDTTPGRAAAAEVAPAGGGRARLVLLDGPNAGRELALDAADMSIGRSPRNQIILADPRISDRHARLLRRPDGGYAVEDAGSTNGSYLNGERIEAPTALNDGDELRLGSTTLIFRSG